MGLHQTFQFDSTSPDEVRSFLRGLAAIALLDERAPDFFVFSELVGEPAFTFDCEITSQGLTSDRAGEYFAFLGCFLEALTGQFGSVTVADA